MIQLIVVLSIGILVAALWKMIHDDQKVRMFIAARADRSPFDGAIGESLCKALEIVVLTIAEDLEVSPLKIYADDNLRDDLGYCMDALGCQDQLDDLIRVISEKTGVAISKSASMNTVLDIARALEETQVCGEYASVPPCAGP